MPICDAFATNEPAVDCIEFVRFYLGKTAAGYLAARH